MKIKLQDYKQQLPEPLKPRTEVFLVRGSEVLLGQKKRGFGKGNWLGIGGKVELGETPEEAAIRESLEEIKVKPLNLNKVAELDFYFPYVEEPKKWNQQVHAFLAKEWEGYPEETDEIFPQ